MQIDIATNCKGNAAGRGVGESERDDRGATVTGCAGSEERAVDSSTRWIAGGAALRGIIDGATMDESELAGLQELAGLFGVSTQFTDDAGRLRVADAATLRGVLRTLGAAVEEAGVEEATRLRRRELASRPIEPVSVAWDGQPMTVAIRHRRSSSPSHACALVLEDGGRIE